MRLADVLVEVLIELGGDNRPIHRSRVIPLAEKRWRDLGHVVKGDFGQEISSAIQEYSSDSKKWRKKANGEDLFEMHKVKGKDGYYSLRVPVLDQL